MRTSARIAYGDPKWNLYLNYLDVQENFNAEEGSCRARASHDPSTLRSYATAREKGKSSCSSRCTC